MSCTSRFVSPCLRLSVAAVLLALLACGQSAAPTAQGAPQATPVGVYRVEARELDSTVMLPGRTVARRVSEVRPQVSGILLERRFEEGSEVAEGQPLYLIDPAPYRAAKARAQAGLATAQNLLTRYDKLLGSKAVSQQQYDDALTALQAAEAELETANINLEHTVVRAPIAGRIGRSMVTEGALVSASQAQELAVLTQLDPIYVDVVQPVSKILDWRESIRAGRLTLSAESDVAVALHLGNGRRYAHSGKLQFSEVNVDAGTGSVTLRAEFPNPNGELLPGMFVHAELNEGHRDDAILLPQQAVQRDPSGQASVWVVAEGNVAQRRGVTLSRTVGNTWLLRDGLAPGETIIVDGAMMLRDGMPVAPREPASPVDISTSFDMAAN